MLVADMKKVYAADVVKKNCENAPAHVKRIHFEGIGRTPMRAVERETGHLFEVKTFKDLVYLTYEACNHMTSLGLFKQCGVVIDTSKDVDSQHGYEVIFVVEEPSRLKATYKMDVDNRGEGLTSLIGQVNSFFGWAESFSIEGSYGTAETTNFNARCRKPVLGRVNTNVGMDIFRSFSRHPWAGFKQTETGVGCDVFHETIAKLKLRHYIRLEAGWRELGPLSKSTPFSVRQEFGHSLKTSIKHALAFNSLDSLIIPQRGIFLNASQEFAGLLGDVNYWRQEAAVSWAVPFLLGSSLSVNARISNTVPLNGSPGLSIADRSFIGGPQNVRGFELNSIGAKDGDAFLGGASTWSAGAHVYRSLIPRHILFAHLFACAGNIVGYCAQDSLTDIARALSERPRYALGVGLAVNFLQQVKLELNYVLPYTDHPSDRVHAGFQFGIGADFL